MALNLDTSSLLTQYQKAQDVEIRRLLDQYGTSLEEMRELYPQLLGAVSRRRLTTTFPNQPFFFSQSEAAEMGLGLQEGWMLKMSPTEGGYKSSLITPQKWEITEDEIYISPEGKEYSMADIQALLSFPTGMVGEIPSYQPATIESLTEEGKRLYEEYQEAGGALDVAGWVEEREQQYLKTEEVFGAVFPERDVSEVIAYMQEQPEAFIADIREIGPTEEMVRFLKTLEFEVEEGVTRPLTEQEIGELFGTAITPMPEYIPESKLKDMWDAFIAGGVGFKQGIETFMFTNPPGEPLSPELINAWTRQATPVAPEFMEGYARELYEKGLQLSTEGYFRRRQEQQEFWISHPELAPNPEYLVSPWKNPGLFKDPGWWGYTISSSLAYSLAVMGTIVAVSAVATPAAGIPAGFAMAAMPEAGGMIDELVDKGVPLNEAKNAGMLYGLAAGGIETASDLPFLGLVFKPIQMATKPFWNTVLRGVANRFVKTIWTGFVITQTEGIEEIFTQVFHNAILKHYDETQSIMEGVSHAWIQATVASLPFAGVGGYASFRTFRANLSQETGQKYDNLVDKFQNVGLSKEQAQVKAANEIAKTPEGEAELSKAIEAAQEEYWETHPELTRPSMEPVIPNLPESILQDIKVTEETKKVAPVTPEVELPEIATGQPYTATVYRGYKEEGVPVDEGLFGKGTYYTTNKEYAETYDGKEVTTVTLNNPFVIQTQQEYEDFQNETTRPARQKALNEGKTVEEADELAAKAAREWLESRGYDGLIARNIIAPGDEVVVFYPEKAVGIAKIKPTIPETRRGEVTEIANQIREHIESIPEIDAYYIFGSLGRELATGKVTLKPTSDLDVAVLAIGEEPRNIIPKLRTVDEINGHPLHYLAYYSVEDFNKAISINKKRGDYFSEAKIPETPTGMPEAGVQPALIEGVPAKEVRPEARGKLVQSRLDDYLRLREYNKERVADRITEIKKALETKGRLPKDLGTKGNLRLELARLDALRELDAIEIVEELDSLIRQVSEEIGIRSLPGQGRPARKGIALARHPIRPNAFPEYTSRQLEEMLKVYQEARQKMAGLPATSTVKAEDIPIGIPAIMNTSLSPIQVQKTIDLFKEAVAAPNTEVQRAAAIELRKHVFAQRAQSASESAEAMIAEGMNPEDAIKAAEQMFMTGKLPDVTTDYFNDLTQEMRNVLFAKVYNYWKPKPGGWTELISTFEALTNALAGKSIPRVKGTGTKYFPDGGSAWDRLARVFIGDEALLEALDRGESLSKIIEGIYLEAGRGSVPLNQDTVNWLKELSTISEEDRILLTKPLSEITENDVRRISQAWFYERRDELNNLLKDGVISEQEYKLEMAMAKDKVFPYRPVSPAPSYPGVAFGLPRLGEEYVAPEALEETRTAEQLRLQRETMEAARGLAEAKAKRAKEPFQPVAIDPKLDDELSKQLPLLTLREKGTIIRNLKNIGLTIVDIGNAVRSLKATLDLSYWRQAAALGAGHPVDFYASNVDAWRALWNQQASEATEQWITRDPDFELYEDIRKKTGADPKRIFEVRKGTEQWRAAEEYGYLTEERPIPRFMAGLPIIKYPGRHFVTGLNSLAWRIWKKELALARSEALKVASGEIVLSEGESFSIYERMAKVQAYLADAIQRASLGRASKLAPALGATFFAPRSKLARFLYPRHLISSDARVRKLAWKDFITWTGVRISVIMLGWWLGLWDVERDPRNAEFMSIRIGNMRIDPWAGYRQFVVLYSRLITRTGISSVTGQEYEVNPIAAMTTFFRSSLAPLSSIILDSWTGKNFLGEDIDIANPEQWVERIAPFAVQDIWEAFRDDWQNGLIAILPAIVGEGVQTYTGDWRENWAKLGLPKYHENTGYGIDEPVYDLADFWADTASKFRGVDPSELTESKGFPEYIRSIAQSWQIIDEIALLPNKRLISINADPEEGPTFKDYYQMWQDRQKIVASGDEEALKAFDADERTRNAYYGNFSQSTYALLMEYHSLPESEQAEFLGKHPELYADLRDEWLRSHPDENALLALWDKADIYSLEALDRMHSLAKSLGIPENALVFEELDEVTKLKIKNQHLFDLEDAFKGLDDTVKDADGLTAKDRALQGLYADNPEFRDDQRRIDALNVGTEDNPTPEDIVEAWVDRGRIVDEYGANSSEAKLWFIDNKEAHQWALDNGLVSDIGEDWNEPIMRLQVEYAEQFDLYDSYGDRDSPDYISNDDARAQARRGLLFSDGRITEFGTAYYIKSALEKEFPQKLIPDYIEWYSVERKDYDDDWWLMEHPEFYQAMYDLEIWTKPRDFSKVPTREVWDLYQTYQMLARGQARYDFRAKYPELDDWLVLAKGYKPVGDKGNPEAETKPGIDVSQFEETEEEFFK